MITGSRRVTRYLPIDHTGEGFGFVTPDPGERFEGRPYHYYCEGSMPFIEVIGTNEQVLRTVNALDCAEIQFATDAAL
jgi:hypothetical protein